MYLLCARDEAEALGEQARALDPGNPIIRANLEAMGIAVVDQDATSQDARSQDATSVDDDAFSLQSV